MSRFNSQAYDKLFPRTQEVEKVESAVETFKPTEKEQKQEVETTVEKAVEEVVIENETEGSDVEVEKVKSRLTRYVDNKLQKGEKKCL